MNGSASDEKKVDWDSAKICLARLQRLAPDILRQGILIGGIACWFYRNLLSKANDPDFGVPILSPVEERQWLSKDIDFTNFFAQDAREMLPEHLVKDRHGRTGLTSFHYDAEALVFELSKTDDVLHRRSNR